MSVLLQVDRFLIHNALERNNVIDLVIAYIAVVAIVYFDKPANKCDVSTRLLSIEKEFSARDFIRKYVGFGDLDAISKQLQDAHQIQKLVYNHVHYTLKPDMLGYKLLDQRFPPPNKGKEDVLMYLLRRVPLSCVHALVTACFFKINIEKITEDLEEQLRGCPETSKRWNSASDEEHLSMYRTLRGKRLACVHAISANTSMAVLKGALEKILGVSVKFKNVDKTFLNLSEGMTYQDGLYIECRALRLGAHRRKDLWGLTNQPVVTSKFKVRCLTVDDSNEELVEVQTVWSDVWVKVSLDVELF